MDHLAILSSSRLLGLTLLGLLVAILIQTSSSPNAPLPSLRVLPSADYPIDFYPNGHDLTLPMGTMRYWLFGNPNGKRVVLIHGISTGAASYDRIARYLADKGHHVLVFDLWGRGYSDAPPASYDESLYTTQLALLLQRVGWEKTNVVGMSLGGGIAASFCAFYPDMVEKLVLIAPAGLLEKNDIPMVGQIASLPLLGKLTLLPVVRPLTIRGVQWFFNSSRKRKLDPQADKLAKVALHQFVHHPGFLRAYMGTVMDFPFSGLHERFKTIGKNTKRSVLVLWGDKDTIVPFRCLNVLQAYVPHASVREYPDGGHDIMATHWETVANDIDTFL